MLVEASLHVILLTHSLLNRVNLYFLGNFVFGQFLREKP